MIAGVWADVGGALVGLAASIGAIASVSSARRSRRAEERAGDAVDVAALAAEQVQPMNGGPTLSGELGARFDGIDRSLELLVTTSRDQSRRIDAQGRELGGLVRRFDEHERKSDERREQVP
ncbi:MAG: hypothetical protein WD556_11445 [Actinomycetota bacterium]